MEWDLEYTPEEDEDMDPASESDLESELSEPRRDTESEHGDRQGSIYSPSEASEQPPGFDISFRPEHAAALNQAQGEAEVMAYCLLRMGRASER